MANSTYLVIGLAVGLLTAVVNLNLLKKAVGYMCRKFQQSGKGHFAVGYLIHLSRFIIYGTTAVLSYKMGMYALGGYTACVVIAPIIMALRMTGKEGADGKLR